MRAWNPALRNRFGTDTGAHREIKRGVAPTVDWSRSDNVAGADVAWPAPHRLVIEGLQNIVYEGQPRPPDQIPHQESRRRPDRGWRELRRRARRLRASSGQPHLGLADRRWNACGGERPSLIRPKQVFPAALKRSKSMMGCKGNRQWRAVRTEANGRPTQRKAVRTGPTCSSKAPVREFPLRQEVDLGDDGRSATPHRRAAGIAAHKYIPDANVRRSGSGSGVLDDGPIVPGAAPAGLGTLAALLIRPAWRPSQSLPASECSRSNYSPSPDTRAKDYG